MNDLRNIMNNLKEIIYKRILSSQNLETFMMNNLQKDLWENVEKYNGKYHNHKKVKLIILIEIRQIRHMTNQPTFGYYSVKFNKNLKFEKKLDMIII